MLKDNRIRLPKIRESARRQSCTLRFDGCSGGVDDVVWCHSPYTEDGSGKGLKADDIFGCYGCASCHDILDGRKKMKAHHGPLDQQFIRDVFHRAMKESWRRLVIMQVLK